MDQLKYFTQEGNIYKMKVKYGFSIFLIAVMLGFTVVGIRTNNQPVIWIFAVLTILIFLSLMTRSLTVDMNKRQIKSKIAFLRPNIEVSIDDIQNFELFTVKNNFITTNVYLNVIYVKKGKEKAVSIAQGFTKKPMQNVLNEIEEIFEKHDNKR